MNAAGQQYVVGLAVNQGWVALIRKAKPAWQAGRLNGIGGKVEPGEDPQLAMAREFEEEAGVATPAEPFGHRTLPEYR